jgi:hypothetical protein
MTSLRHRIRKWLWAVRLRDLWVVNGKLAKLNERCDRLEEALRELNPGWRP